MGKLHQKAFWIGFGDIANRAFYFFASIYLARTLGADYYGLIVISISILGYSFWFSDLGLVNVAVREIAKPLENRIYGTKQILNLKVFLGIIVFILSFLVIYSLNMPELDKKVILGYMYSIIPYALLLEWYFNGKQNFGKVAISKFANGLVYFLLIIILIKKPADVETVPYLYFTGSAITSVVLGLFFFYEPKHEKTISGNKSYTDLLKTSSIVGVGWFFAQAVQLLPPIVIGIFLSVGDAGLYGAAYRIIIVVMLLDRIFVNLLLPNLSATWNFNKKQAEKHVNLALKLIIIGSTTLTLLLVLNANFVVGLLYGTEYQESANILKYLSFFIVFTFMNSSFSFGMLATGKDYDYLKSNIVGGVIATVLIFVIAIVGTPIAVAAAVSISEFFIMILAYFWFKRTIPVSFIKAGSITGLTAIGCYYLADYFDMHFILSSIMSVLVIALISGLTGLLRKEDFRWLKIN